MGSFTIEDGEFRLHGTEFRLLSGAMHYFRVHPDQWSHRLAMIRAMGLNTVETYVPWNLHEARPGQYRRLDELDRFLEAASRADLHAIVRPGPYICAEWENGGLPSWVTGHLRTSDPAFLAHVDRWFEALLPRIAAHQITRGGNVLMVQVENEYGSYGTDTAYLRHLAGLMRSAGIDVPLFTADGPEDYTLTGGSLPGVLATATFGSDPAKAISALRRHRPDDPVVCMELWVGWFDHWGREHVTRDAAEAAAVLAELLEAGASVNIYMAHGGTNFGTWAGANHDLETGAYLPTVTSYDYDAPISESGAPTEKYRLFRDVLTRYNPAPEPPPAPPVLPAATVRLTESAALLPALTSLAEPPAVFPTPPAFEDLGLDHGLVLYRVEVPGPRGSYPLIVDGLHDRAHVYVDGVHVAALDRERQSVEVSGPATVELLVESLGRVNYGPRMGERKGVTGGIRHERQYLHQVTAQALPLGDLPLGGTGVIPFVPGPATVAPAFCRGFVPVDDPADTFLALPGWGHGYVWVNGFCLGRYSSAGPQRTLYVPGPLLRTGDNEFVVLELDEVGDPVIELRPEPDLGARPEAP
ncbi:glycoside hydrolase family 35 protein [Nonomuraea rhodomycinica]|uniref:Beta-galactosidase n=1 Tax=Nonomuraea rhodomycinica TaxID=1712872 RepID=A0A7Y6MFM9_9ACTN|nr:beta-galactosidase family protein [Nonomuraea rhodomycinica]NUW46097.1 beta-galactosidase [Nonomuraea rhodomycinica]